MGLFKNKYRIESARRQGFDYALEGFYFVTICTRDKELYFGNVADRKMTLSEVGRIIRNEWLKTEEIRKNVRLDEFIVMPNHLHGIVMIKYALSNNIHCVETHCNASLQYEYKNKFGPQSNNLSAIIRGFKGAAKTVIKINFPEQNFAWQARFHDRVIRDENELNKIRQYIIDNPEQWELDRNNKNDLYI